MPRSRQFSTFQCFYRAHFQGRAPCQGRPCRGRPCQGRVQLVTSATCAERVRRKGSRKKRSLEELEAAVAASARKVARYAEVCLETTSKARQVAFAKKRETLAKTAALTVHPPMPRVPQRPPSAAVAQRPQRHAIGQRQPPAVDVSEDEGHVISDGEPSHDDAGERKAKTRKRKRQVFVGDEWLQQQIAE